jgi:hypothetical protein
LKIGHGKLRSSKTYGSVERANQGDDTFSTSPETNHTRKWSKGLQFVQLRKTEFTID